MDFQMQQHLQHCSMKVSQLATWLPIFEIFSNPLKSSLILSSPSSKVQSAKSGQSSQGSQTIESLQLEPLQVESCIVRIKNVSPESLVLYCIYSTIKDFYPYCCSNSIYQGCQKYNVSQGSCQENLKMQYYCFTVSISFVQYLN